MILSRPAIAVKGGVLAFQRGSLYCAHFSLLHRLSTWNTGPSTISGKYGPLTSPSHKEDINPFPRHLDFCTSRDSGDEPQARRLFSCSAQRSTKPPAASCALKISIPAPPSYHLSECYLPTEAAFPGNRERLGPQYLGNSSDMQQMITLWFPPSVRFLPCLPQIPGIKSMHTGIAECQT